jgi:hypothetical protein
MRKPKYMSPSSLQKWLKDRKEYFLCYLADNRAPRIAQTPPMSIGSAFDAFVKSSMHFSIFGNYGKDNQFKEDAIFASQVESQNRDKSFVAGKFLFEKYKECGALRDILTEIARGIGEPRFEIALEGTVGVSGTHGGVPIMCKPDLMFRNVEGMVVIFDWKVNGYYSKSRVSPMAGYIKCRDAYGERTRSHNTCHKDAFLQMYKGTVINVASFLEQHDEDWATQLSTYSWMFGERIGSETIAWIDQLVCSPSGGEYPNLRIATHKSRVSHDFQFKAIKQYQDAWDRIQEGYIFTDLTREDSDKMCAALENQYTSTGPNDDWFNQITRESRPY